MDINSIRAWWLTQMRWDWYWDDLRWWFNKTLKCPTWVCKSENTANTPWSFCSININILETYGNSRSFWQIERSPVQRCFRCRATLLWVAVKMKVFEDTCYREKLKQIIMQILVLFCMRNCSPYKQSSIYVHVINYHCDLSTLLETK